MKIACLVSFLLLSACSDLKYEWEYGKQRREAKRGSDYLAWKKAEIEVEKKCLEVDGIYQGHSRVVSVSFKDGTGFSTISPEIDEIFSVIHRCRGNEDGISVIME